MTKGEALELMRQYSVYVAENTEALVGSARSTFTITKRTHLLSMPLRFPENGSERKAMRWLGFMQGALWMVGAFSMAELKEHSRQR